jgi:hypothetical protein
LLVARGGAGPKDFQNAQTRLPHLHDGAVIQDQNADAIRQNNDIAVHGGCIIHVENFEGIAV